MDYQSLSIEELVRECAKGSGDAWKEFDRRFRVRPIGRAAISVCRKWGKTPQEYVEDLINETYQKLLENNCAPLVRFKFNPMHENAFLSWLWAVAASVSHDFFRRICKVELVELDDSHPSGGYGNPEATEMILFFDDVDRALQERESRSQEQKERTVFWLYYRQGFTAKAIAAIPSIKLSVKGVESVIFRLTGYIRGLFGKRPDK